MCVWILCVQFPVGQIVLALKVFLEEATGFSTEVQVWLLGALCCAWSRVPRVLVWRATRRHARVNFATHPLFLAGVQQLYIGDKLLIDPLSLNDYPDFLPGRRVDVRLVISEAE